MHRLKLSPWLYFTTVTVIGIGLGVIAATVDNSEGRISLAVGVLLLSMLTYPAGIIGTLCGMPLIFMGLVTPAEALAISAPVYAISGTLQWYVILPRVFARREGAIAANADPAPTTSPPTD